ncbi:hemoglobin [Roseovarius azorensis]|uniref:Hemoglobin n=1 Tax=Roseovarius azorensis TaxID=1287727 RepID=A0A1H7FWR3_9RHOB|nr:group II truncated hemoglobin [Roseovarius azorensis]SEK28922.1 hemoglobin [Roseovarius azorensis]
MSHRMIDVLDGEDAVRSLVERFYDLIETLPEGENLRRLHRRGQGIDTARTEQFNFLTGFLGGRRYYEEKHGHMDLRLMHAHVPISLVDTETWLALMDRALADLGHTGPEIDTLRRTLRRVALRLVNDLGEWGTPAKRPSP